MSPSDIHTIKIVAGTLVAAGIGINFFERLYKPHHLLLESSPNFPAWLGWAGWILGSAAALAYFVADYIE